MLIIADSSALVALAICNGLGLLDQLFEEIKVPQTVFNEVVVAVSRFRCFEGGYFVCPDKSNDFLLGPKVLS